MFRAPKQWGPSPLILYPVPIPLLPIVPTSVPVPLQGLKYVCFRHKMCSRNWRVCSRNLLYSMCSRILTIKSNATYFKWKCVNLISSCTVSEVKCPTPTVKTSTVVRTRLVYVLAEVNCYSWSAEIQLHALVCQNIFPGAKPQIPRGREEMRAGREESGGREFSPESPCRLHFLKFPMV